MPSSHHLPLSTSYPTRSTPVPNALLDRLPDLGSAELRVLLVVARQTLGWQDPITGGRKGADWLTQRQLLARTGCSRAPLSRAIDTLVRKRLLAVTGRAGEPLDTPEARRRYRGQLWYRLVMPGLVMPLEDAAGGGTGSETPLRSSESAHRSSESERIKLNTTKESPDKKKNGAVLSSNTQTLNTLPGTALRIYSPTAGHILAAMCGQEAQSAGKDWHWDGRQSRWLRQE